MSLVDFKSLLIKAISFVMSFLLGILALIYLAQVIFRYVIFKPIVWIDELSGYMLVWVVFLGVVVALGDGTHIKIDVFLKLLPRYIRLYLIWACDILVMFVAIILTIYGYVAIKGSLGTRATSIDVSYAVLYSIIFISGALMIIIMSLNWLTKKK